MKKNRTAILKNLCACALTITMAFVVPSAGYAAGTDTLGFGAGGPGTNVDAYGNPVSGVVAKGITVSKYQYRASAVKRRDRLGYGEEIWSFLCHDPFGLL